MGSFAEKDNDSRIQTAGTATKLSELSGGAVKEGNV